MISSRHNYQDNVISNVIYFNLCKFLKNYNITQNGPLTTMECHVLIAGSILILSSQLDYFYKYSKLTSKTNLYGTEFIRGSIHFDSTTTEV